MTGYLARMAMRRLYAQRRAAGQCVRGYHPNDTPQFQACSSCRAALTQSHRDQRRKRRTACA